MTRLFLIAGEASGDLLGGALLAGLHELTGELELEGVGGAAMAAEGLASRFPMEELSVMGIAEVLPRLPNLLCRISETADAVVAARPDALVTIDSPDFTLRVARKAKARLPGLRVIHYVAPSVWAWRPGRARKMAQVVDHVLALLPFEPPYMIEAGMTCDFVGHPAATLPQASPEEVAAQDAAEVECVEDELSYRLRAVERAAQLRAGELAPHDAKLLEQLCVELRSLNP